MYHRSLHNISGLSCIIVRKYYKFYQIDKISKEKIKIHSLSIQKYQNVTIVLNKNIYFDVFLANKKIPFIRNKIQIEKKKN